MNDQVAGNDGSPDSILVRVTDGNLQVLLASGAEQLAYSGPAASVQSLTLIGSSDAETFTIDGAVNVPVNITSKSGNDTYAIDLASAGARNVTITDIGPATNHLIVTSNASNASIGVSDTRLVQGAQVVSFVGVSSVTVNDTSPANQIHLRPSSSTAFTIVGSSDRPTRSRRSTPLRRPELSCRSTRRPRPTRLSRFRVPAAVPGPSTTPGPSLFHKSKSPIICPLATRAL